MGGGRSEVIERKLWHHISSEKEAKQIVWKYLVSMENTLIRKG